MAETGSKCRCRSREQVRLLGEVGLGSFAAGGREVVMLLERGALVAAGVGWSSSVAAVDDHRLTRQACYT